MPEQVRDPQEILDNVCPSCVGKHYLKVVRDNGLEAIERCDICSSKILFDADAALLAEADGIAAMHEYPCYIIGKIWRE